MAKLVFAGFCYSLGHDPVRYRMPENNHASNKKKPDLYGFFCFWKMVFSIFQRCFDKRIRQKIKAIRSVLDWYTDVQKVRQIGQGTEHFAYKNWFLNTLFQFLKRVGKFV